MKSMRGEGEIQTAKKRSVAMARRVPIDHSARQIRAMVDGARERMDGEPKACRAVGTCLTDGRRWWVNCCNK